MNRKRAFLAIAFIALGAVAAFAQSRTSFNVVCNEAGAQVYLNGRIAGTTNPNFSILLSRGTYDVSVQKKGFEPFVTKVTMATTPITLNVVLVRTGSAVTPPPAVNYNVSVNANVSGADVYINNVLAGKVPLNVQLPSGSYTVAVKAAGYSDYNQNVRVSGSLTVNAVLQGLTVPLNLGSLLPGAEVFLNGVSYGRTTSGQFSTQVMPGTYTLTIRLGGYFDFSTQITVGSSGYSLVPALQPLTASYTFEIPPNILNPDVKGNPWSQIRLYVDGVAQKDFRGQVQAGKHMLKLVTGAFLIEMEFDFEAGKSYAFQPFAGMGVKQ